MSHRRKEEDRKPRPWESDRSGGGADSFGDWLKRQRELRDIGLREVSDTTKINLRYLEALEENRFSALPAAVFARGFLREYARYVGLDADEVLNYYDAAQQEQEPESEDGPRPRRLHSSTQWLYGLVLTLAVVGLFGLVAAMSFWAERRPAPDEPPPIAPPVFEAAPPAPVDPAAEAPLEVTLDFSENCWVEATLDGKERISELRVQGESLRLTADERVLLTLGNAPGVRVEVNGAPFEIASTEETVRDLEITLASIGGGAGASTADGAATGAAGAGTGPVQGSAANGAIPAPPARVPTTVAGAAPATGSRAATASRAARGTQATPTPVRRRRTATPPAPTAGPDAATDPATDAATPATSLIAPAAAGVAPATGDAAARATPAAVPSAEPPSVPATALDATPAPRSESARATGRGSKTPKPKATPKKTPRRKREGDGQ